MGFTFFDGDIYAPNSSYSYQRDDLSLKPIAVSRNSFFSSSDLLASWAFEFAYPLSNKLTLKSELLYTRGIQTLNSFINPSVIVKIKEENDRLWIETDDIYSAVGLDLYTPRWKIQFLILFHISIYSQTTRGQAESKTYPSYVNSLIKIIDPDEEHSDAFPKNEVGISDLSNNFTPFINISYTAGNRFRNKIGLFYGAQGLSDFIIQASLYYQYRYTTKKNDFSFQISWDYFEDSFKYINNDANKYSKPIVSQGFGITVFSTF